MTGAAGVLIGAGAIYIGVGLVTFVACGLDKRAAQRGSMRMRERTLHLWSAAGGVLGAWLGRRVFRHKTRKRGFLAIELCIAAAHLVGWGVALAALAER